MKSLLSLLLFISISVSSQTTKNEAEKIASFCQIWGFLKYYHPVVAKGSCDWNLEFRTRLKDIMPLHTRQELSNYYVNWILSMGKLKTCTSCINDVADSLKFNVDERWMDNELFNVELEDMLVSIQNNRFQGEHYYVKYNGQYQHNVKLLHEEAYKDSVFPSAELRLLGLAHYWNVVNYFFPYKYKIGSDWKLILEEMIPKYRDAKDTMAYHLAMLETVAKINDSHANFVTEYTNRYFGYKWAPFKFKLIDNKAIVTGFYNEVMCRQNDICYGDVFLTVDGKSIKDIIKKQWNYVPASNDPVKLRKMYFVIFNGQSDSVKVSFERNNTIYEKMLYRYEYKQFNVSKVNKDTTYKIIPGNIGYVNMGVLERNEVHKMMAALEHTKAIIFDLRNYPNGTLYDIAFYLNSESKPFAAFREPDLNYPGVYKYTTPYYCGSDNKKAYKGKVVLLFNETTQSHSEFTAMVLQTAPNVISIGSQTSGADGDVSYIVFPGNYSTAMTGIGVYYPDGRETQRIGIVPDIEVKPTIEGIRAKKDEVLEKAVEIINGK
ncbi:MAG: S41 family peptidase [Bacteroidota bacterium]